MTQGWVPKGEIVTIANRRIDGMIYVGPAPLLNSHGYDEECRAYIDPSLSVAWFRTDRSGDDMPYWPGYSNISPVCRATYLDWLANGKSDGSYDPGYLFLYFYGLERRFIADHPSNEEKQEILEEVRRLKDIYSENSSVRRHLGDFIEIAQISLGGVSLHEPVFASRNWDLPLSVKIAIGAKIADGSPLSSDWLLSWFLCHPECRLRTAATRCGSEFRELLRLRFEKRFPRGLKISAPKKILEDLYCAASGEFEAEINPRVNGKPVPDISDLHKPIKIAQVMADVVMDDLDKFSRFLGRNPNGRGSIEAQALLPSELWSVFPSEELEKLKDWAESVVEKGGLVITANVIAQLEGERPEKIEKQQLTDAADALARIGFGMAPDPRFALRAPKLEEPVVIFALGEAVEQLEDVSGIYRKALMQLALGAFVAHADNLISEVEKKALHTQVSKIEGITDLERKRLYANLEWLFAVPPDMSLLRRKLKNIGTRQQAALRADVTAIAHADNVIQVEEVARIEKIYKALGLDVTEAYADLHEGSVMDDPVHVKSAQKGAPGESIPAEAPVASTELNHDKIADIRSDTKRASSILSAIFADDENMELSASAFPASRLKGLDIKHTDLVREIVAQKHWSEADFAAWAKKHGLIPLGALETLNEWAFERYDDALLDEDGGYTVVQDISEKLKTELG